MEITIGIDAGNKVSGIIVLLDREKIIYAANADNEQVIPLIKEYRRHWKNTSVIIEDIKPYSLKMGQTVIDTIKYIGQLEYRLNEAEIAFKLIGRNEVKQWVFDNFREICVRRIDKRIEYLSKRKESKGEKGLRNKDGELRKASFIWVDDRVMIEAMKSHWSIPTPKPGKTNEYGISAHAWQALALVTCEIKKPQ